MPGVSYEQKITNNQTIHLAAFMDAAFLSQTTNDHTEFKVLFAPTCSVAFRNYYNIKKRYQKGFNTASNSANYFAPVYMGRYPLSDEFVDHEWVNQIGAIWGLQRTGAKGFSLDLSLGAAYTFENPDLSYYNPIEPIIQIAIGYKLGHKAVNLY